MVDLKDPTSTAKSTYCFLRTHSCCSETKQRFQNKGDVILIISFNHIEWLILGAQCFSFACPSLSHPPASLWHQPARCIATVQRESKPQTVNILRVLKEAVQTSIEILSTIENAYWRCLMKNTWVQMFISDRSPPAPTTWSKPGLRRSLEKCLLLT